MRIIAGVGHWKNQNSVLVLDICAAYGRRQNRNYNNDQYQSNVYNIDCYIDLIQSQCSGAAPHSKNNYIRSFNQRSFFHSDSFAPLGTGNKSGGLVTKNGKCFTFKRTVGREHLPARIPVPTSGQRIFQEKAILSVEQIERCKH